MSSKTGMLFVMRRLPQISTRTDTLFPATTLFRSQSPLGERSLGLRADCACAFGDGPDLIQRAEFAQQARHAFRQHLLFLRKSEVHHCPPCADGPLGRSRRGSRGMLRPRSEMMFFWIWAVPPDRKSTRLNSSH